VPARFQRHRVDFTRQYSPKQIPLYSILGQYERDIEVKQT
jgi:hypothetical protein